MENTQELGYGWLYVVTHPNGRGLIKIGITDRPTARMNDLGDPEVLARVPVKNPRKHESDLHVLYQAQRLPQSEWFNLDEKERADLLSSVALLADKFLSLVVIPNELTPAAAVESPSEKPGESPDMAGRASAQVMDLKNEIRALKESNGHLTARLRAQAGECAALQEKNRLLAIENEQLLEESKKNAHQNLEESKKNARQNNRRRDAFLQLVSLNKDQLAGLDMRGADFREANLAAVNLYRCDLSGADLSGCNLHGANLQAANLSSSDLSSASLVNAELLHIVWDRETKWPAADRFSGAKNIPIRLREQLRLN